MSEKKKMLLQILCFILLSIPVCTGTYMYISSNFLPNTEEVYEEYYLEYIEKCELLESIAQDTIIEGQGFALDKIDTENIGYRITPNGETIEFYYYIIDTYGDGLYQYNATITLSENYEIIEEEYSKSKEDVGSEDEYVARNIKSGNITIPLLSICIGLLLSVGISTVVYIIIEVITLFKQKK